ncbi:MAG: tetratricopeptide repeat protein [Anaerolineae bacterium]|nr:tetratricopeptide repeat protein [Anaerolineae bacterium]
MASGTQEQLKKAYELIYQDRVDEALAILRPITQAQPDNRDAWWLTANAASDPRDARRALVTVLKLDPSHTKARGQLDSLNEMYPPRDDELAMMLELPDPEPEPAWPTAEGTQVSSPTAAVPTDEIDALFGNLSKTPVPGSNTSAFDFGDDALPPAPKATEADWGKELEGDPFADLLKEDGAEKPRQSGGGRRRTLLLVAVALVLVVALVGGLLLLSSSDGEDEASIADATLLPAVADPGALVALDPADQPALINLRDVTTTNAQTVLGSEAGAVLVETPEGAVLVVRLCGEPSPRLPALASTAIRIAARQAATQPAVHDVLSGVGVSVEDCRNANDTLYRATAPLEAALTFVADAATDEASAFTAFQARWTVQN